MEDHCRRFAHYYRLGDQMGQTLSYLDAARYVFFTFLPDQFFSKLPTINEDLTGRTFLITGSNTGLGFASAIHLARMKPARLILGVRDLGKGTKAKEEIIAQTNFAGSIDVWELDMTKFDSVKSFAHKLNSSLDRLDGAIINAGITNPPRWDMTSDGWEKTLQVNGVSTGLLAVLLLPLLQTTTKLPPPHPDVSQTPPHLTITGSAAQFLTHFPEKNAPNILQTLNDPSSRPITPDRYAITKLFNLFLAREIGALSQAQGVVVNVVDPGLCASDIGRNRKLGGLANWLYHTVAWPISKGAINMVYAVLMPTPSGAFVTSCQIRRPPAWTTTQFGLQVQKKVWNEMVEVWQGLAPEVADIVR